MLLLTGATGLIGAELTRRFTARDVRVRTLSRGPGRYADVDGVEELAWDGIRPPEGALDGVTAIVHLSGEPIFGGLPTEARKKRLYTSRVDSTRAIVTAIGERPEHDRPDVLVCASAVGYYGDRGDEALEEAAAPGTGLLADLCVDWETAAAEARRFGVRVCQIRTGIVLSSEGGALPLMATPFKLGLGGRLGDGRQWFPWIHLDDIVGLFERAVLAEDWTGPINGTAPHPVRNRELTKTLGQVLGRPTLLPVPAFAVRLALGELSGELLGSKRAVPSRAGELGYAFAFDALDAALRHELG